MACLGAWGYCWAASEALRAASRSMPPRGNPPSDLGFSWRCLLGASREGILVYMSTPVKTVEGKVELTADALVLHGINRFQGAVVIPRGNIASIHAKTASESGGLGLPTLVITTNSGDTYSRRGKWNAYKTLLAFAAEAVAQ